MFSTCSVVYSALNLAPRDSLFELSLGFCSLLESCPRPLLLRVTCVVGSWVLCPWVASLSSDKTNIMNMCRGRVTHPLLISLANIKMAVWNKGSSHAFLLLAFLPTPQFVHPVQRMCSVLEAHLIHSCLDIILEPLKQAACIGWMMLDPVENL